MQQNHTDVKNKFYPVSAPATTLQSILRVLWKIVYFFFFQLNQWFWKHLLIHIISLYKILLYYYCCTQIKVLIWSIEPISSIPAFVYSQVTLHGWVNSSLLWLPRKLNMKQELRADALLGYNPQDMWVRDKFEQERWGVMPSEGSLWATLNAETSAGLCEEPTGFPNSHWRKEGERKFIRWFLSISCLLSIKVHLTGSSSPLNFPGCISQIV